MNPKAPGEIRVPFFRLEAKAANKNDTMMNRIVMIWSLDQDAEGSKSLLAEIDRTLKSP